MKALQVVRSKNVVVFVLLTAIGLAGCMMPLNYGDSVRGHDAEFTLRGVIHITYGYEVPDILRLEKIFHPTKRTDYPVCSLHFESLGERYGYHIPPSGEVWLGVPESRIVLIDMFCDDDLYTYRYEFSDFVLSAKEGTTVVCLGVMSLKWGQGHHAPTSPYSGLFDLIGATVRGIKWLFGDRQKEYIRDGILEVESTECNELHTSHAPDPETP